MTLGLPYATKVWEQQWPQVIDNVIAAAKQHGFKIIFLDNIYMYGPAPLANPITEGHAQHPASRKGVIRKQIADCLQEAQASGEVSMVIGRSADFYGPGAKNSLLYINMLQNLLRGKKAQFIGNPDTKHTFTYTQDAGRALVRLAMDDSAYGKVWHLPTATPAHTIRKLVDIMAGRLQVSGDVNVMPKVLVKVLKTFVPILKEVDEMTYQTESDYIFSSKKFMQKYPDFRITPYATGLQATIDSFGGSSIAKAK